LALANTATPPRRGRGRLRAGFPGRSRLFPFVAQQLDRGFRVVAGGFEFADTAFGGVQEEGKAAHHIAGGGLAGVAVARVSRRALRACRGAAGCAAGRRTRAPAAIPAGQPARKGSWRGRSRGCGARSSGAWNSISSRPATPLSIGPWPNHSAGRSALRGCTAGLRPGP
jgi:hypothetical protein